MPAERGQPGMRQAAWDGSEYGHAVAGQIHGPAHADRGDHRDQRAGDSSCDPPGGQHDHDDPDRHRQVSSAYVRKRVYDVPEPGQGVFSGGSHSEHVGELAGRHLDTDAGEESDQDGAGEEIRQEPEPGQPGQQQQRAGEQGCEPGQPDVSLRPGDREPGQRGGEDGGGGRVRADDEMARRTEDGEHGHREQQRVQAGHHRHPGDLRVPENLGDAQGGQRHAGEHVRGYPGPVDRQQSLHHGHCPQPSPLMATARSRHRLAPARFPAVSDSLIIPPGRRFIASPRPRVSARPGLGEGPRAGAKRYRSFWDPSRTCRELRCSK